MPAIGSYQILELYPLALYFHFFACVLTVSFLLVPLFVTSLFTSDVLSNDLLKSSTRSFSGFVLLSKVLILEYLLFLGTLHRNHLKKVAYCLD